MATSKYLPAKGHRAKLTRQHVLSDADDNATAVVTLPGRDVYSGHIIIDEIVAGYNAAAASKFITIAQGAASMTLPVVSGVLGVENPPLEIPEAFSILAAGTDVTVTLDASGSAGVDGALSVKWRYTNER